MPLPRKSERRLGSPKRRFHFIGQGRYSAHKKNEAERRRRNGRLPQNLGRQIPLNTYTKEPAKLFAEMSAKKWQAAEERNRHAVCAS